MKISMRHLALSSMLLAVPALGACSSNTGPEPGDHSVGQTDQEIIGGVAANSPKLNAIGSLGYRAGSSGPFQLLCSGTLITPTMVLTAQHCVDFVADPTTQLAFLIGPDASAPLETIPVKGVAWEDTVQGGLVGLGIDLAVMHLAQPVTDVTPLAYAQLTPDRVGQKFTALGYGIRDAHQSVGQRRAGTETLQQVGGRLYQAIYGTFEKFVADSARFGFNPSDTATLQSAWDTTLLQDGIEGWFGHGANDAQSCYGDSGGPMTSLANGKQTVYGVTSWGAYSDFNEVCQLGAAYTILEPKGLDFIDYQTACPLVPAAGGCADLNTAIRCIPKEEGDGHYRQVNTDCSGLGEICALGPDGVPGCVDDPCDGIPAQGACQGNVAVRCSNANEGPRHVVSTDCTATGNTCSTDSGQAACTGTVNTTCSHEVCAQGGALTTSCGACTNSICTVDPFCCNIAWDSICVNEVASVCQETCPGAPSSAPGIKPTTR